jgi:thiamine transport system permease protein
MAARAGSVTRRVALTGGLAAGVILLLVIGSIVAVAFRAEGWSGLKPSDWAALRFTVMQAVLSSVISVGLAIPVARALARRQFRGRSALITLLGAPFILPVIVAVFGLLAVFGRSGIASQALGWLGLPPLSIFGLHGVVLAHVFFNLPLAVRLILQGWMTVPAERFRLAASLGFGARDVARHIEWPVLREVVPGALMAVFLICTTSFAVALTLGGGPRATTIELAIYQAFRFDFDLSRAALLALLQVAVSGTAALIALRIARPAGQGGGLDRVSQRWDAATSAAKATDAALLTTVALFLLMPLLIIVLRGVPGLFNLPAPVFAAAGRSVLVALVSTALTIALALPLAALAYGMRARGGKVVEGLGYLTIAASPLVIGTGLFIVLFPFANPVALALPVTALVNAAMALPFALRVLAPALAGVEEGYGRLADSLRLTGLARLRLLWLPRLRRPLGFAAGLAAALSMGDLGVVALFADPEGATLPLVMYRLMAAYRTEDAAAAALLLLMLSLLAFWVFDRGGRMDADA